MRRGTTIKNLIDVDIDLTDAESVYVTYMQSGEIVTEKDKDDIDIQTDMISVALSQEDTLSFKPDIPIKVQISARIGDEVFRSNIMHTNAEDILKDEAI